MAAKNMAELVQQMQTEGQTQKYEDTLSPEEQKALKFEKIVFQYADTMKGRGGCYTSTYLNEVREIIKEKIKKGEINL